MMGIKLCTSFAHAIKYQQESTMVDIHGTLETTFESMDAFKSVTARYSLSLSLLVFYITCNDISVIYVTAQMCRRIEEEVPTVGLPTS